MSLHRSLKSKGSLLKHRNVLKKRERIQRLQEEDNWPEEDPSAFGLPKVRNIKVTSKKPKPAEEETPAAEAEEVAQEAALEPAEGAAPAGRQ